MGSAFVLSQPHKDIHTETQYNGFYTNADIVLTEDFLLFEHTDGLNYENVELRRLDALYERKKFSINVEEGLGIGFVYPRTNTPFVTQSSQR